jgi:hypothetical protein
MNKAAIVLAVLSLPVAGCGWLGGKQAAPASPVAAEARGPAMAVGIDLPARTFSVGESFQAIVTVTNLTNRPIHIASPSGALVHVLVWRNTGLAWDEVKSYPPSAVRIVTTWTLDKRSQRKFVIPLTVEPDWPTGEPLQMSAEVNGVDQLSPKVDFEVLHPAGP